MKTLTLGISCALLACAALAPVASAQRNYDQRRDVPDIVNADRDYRGDRGGDWDRRIGRELERLNGEVAETRRLIGNVRDPRVRDRFHSIRERADRLTAAWNRHRMSGWEARGRIDDIRGQLSDLRREVARRYGR